MGDCIEQRLFEGSSLPASVNNLIIDEAKNDNETMVCNENSSDSLSFSDDSSMVSTSSDFTDDATSSTFRSSSPPLAASPSTSPQLASDGPLYELSELIAHLPIKRGLSKHYQGKSQSFTSLSSVRCVEDLAKEKTPYSKKMKSCRSYGGFSDCQKSYTPRSCTKTITKKAPKSSLSCLQSKKISFTGCRPPLPVPKSFSM